VVSDSRLAVAVVAVGLLLASAAPTAPAHGGASRTCENPGAGRAYTRKVLRALAATRDVWGEALLAAPGGPSYEGASRRLAPLLLARGPHRRRLTESGVYYVPLADPPASGGTSDVDLHVADGSQIVSRRIGGKSLTISVGPQGDERFGSCLGRLTPARLRDGYLPILETGYTDASRVVYRQESFSTHVAGSRALVAFVHVAADARQATGDVLLRLGATVVPIHAGTTADVYASWSGKVAMLDAAAYAAARDSLAGAWERRLAEGMQIFVPERRVEDAWRALRAQNLILGWRYSIGNPYEELSFPEEPDVAQVMGEQGYGEVERALLEASLARGSSGYASWKRGERLFVSAMYFRLFRDRGYVDTASPRLAGYVAALGKALGRDGVPILGRERYSSDIPDRVFGLHAQTVAWAGLRAMAAVWAETGRPELAQRARTLAVRLEGGLRNAVRASERRLPDGSLFVPARLLDSEPPYRTLVEARSGSYWNLVTPYALSSGFFTPGSVEAEGILRYLLGHGARLLGLVRAGAYALYGRSAPFPISGTDEVYGVNVARFLADNDRPDQLVLSLYGQLAAGMTPGTFVAGEAASVAPLDGRRYRAMYLPPSSTANAAFLETLRLMLVHETVDRSGAPYGLQLAYATPRAWLHPGARVAVENAPTSFGPVSFSITASRASAHVRVVAPGRAMPKRLTLRLRLPHATRTIDLSGRTGTIELDVR
jgi:hypothetical protein